ncbi:hypothetical protein PF008_g11882 [Phytophthora fragariae]|uniref:Uncharacterized protein n=1 Tax=Phytophthora fragariae TaxID=53985 RepID=A0A6G0RPG0_9STRA|nr:hypothetical protein PF008_g11882 [Phytophthora fragariae]
MERWNASYKHLLEQSVNREELTPAAPEGYLPDDERTSLFSCLIHGLGTVRADFIEDLNGSADPGELELYSASKLHNWNIEIKTLSTDCKVVSTFVYTVDNPDKVVQLVRSGAFFAVKVDGYLL